MKNEFTFLNESKFVVRPLLPHKDNQISLVVEKIGVDFRIPQARAELYNSGGNIAEFDSLIKLQNDIGVLIYELIVKLDIQPAVGELLTVDGVALKIKSIEYAVIKDYVVMLTYRLDWF